MIDMRDINNRKIYITCVYLLIFGMFLLSVARLYGFTIYPDEFGYWATAASTIGFDWSEIASLGSYYSFGYSILLIPILKIFKNPLVAYRVAIAINYIFIALGFTLLQKIAGKVYGKADDDVRNTLICCVAVFYPPWILYSQTTMAESELIFLFILLCYFMVNYLHKPNIPSLIFMALTAAYMYSVHMRSIGMIIALLIVFVIVGLKDKRSRWFVLGLIILGIIAALALVYFKRQVISNVFSYADADSLEINSYGSQMAKIRHILTKDGIKLFVIEVISKFYYLTASTFGLFVLSMISMLRGTIRLIVGIVKRRKIALASYFKLFVLLTVLAEIAISAIYTHDTFRPDGLLYGRYDEFVAPVIIMMGLYEIFKYYKRGRIDKVIICEVATAVALLVLPPLMIYYLNLKEGMAKSVSFFISGMSYLSQWNEYDYKLFIWRGALSSVVLLIVFFMATWASLKVRYGSFLLGLLVVIQLMLGYRLSEMWPFRVNDFLYTNYAIIEKFEEHPERTIYYLNSGVSNCVDFYQFNMPNTHIVLVAPWELDNIDLTQGYLLVDWSYPDMQMLRDRYNKSIDKDMFSVFYLD